jgi:NADH-ubiquinone oxidoreductase chain 2
VLINSLISLLLSNSITLRRDKSILYSRATTTILLISSLIAYDNLYFLFLNKGIGMFGGLFHSTCTTSVFHIFILLISSVILVLTSFYPRKVWLKEYSSMDRLLFSKLVYYQTMILNKMGEQYKIIEYSLIILFIVIGAIFLVSTSDLVSIFLSIELQSYGLYLLSTIYRDSESATSGGLMYFLLGGLSSCFILLSTGLLYANSGTTNLDSLYIITSISNVSKDSMTSLLY